MSKIPDSEFVVLWVMYTPPKKKCHRVHGYIFKNLEEAVEIQNKTIKSSWTYFDIEVF